MHTDKLLTRSILAGACVVGALAGCSSTPPPREQLAVGRSSIDAAQTAGAAQLAPVELTRAREKYDLAVAAARDKQYVTARRLAEEADVDAQVARTKANAERSRKAAEEVMAGLQTLKQELNDKTASDRNLMPNPPAAGSTNMPNDNSGSGTGGNYSPSNRNLDGQKISPNDSSGTSGGQR